MATINGNNSNNTLNGTSSADTIHGLGGADTISGKGGADYLYGDSGGDTLYGDAGNDRLWGGTGADALWGGDNDDQLYGEGGNDYMKGGLGNDYLHGGSGDDRLRGDEGNDTLHSGGGTDDLQGGAGNDTLIHYARASAGNPVGTARYDGGTGTDTLTFDIGGTFRTPYGDWAPWLQVTVGQSGTGSINLLTDPDEGNNVGVGDHRGIDTFRLNSADHSFDFSARANVTVYGGSADDRMEGVNGNQTFIGGAGADDYRFLWRDDVGAAGGNDRIIGFNKAEDDTLGFSVNNGEFENNEHITFDVREANGHTIFKLIGDDTGQVYNTIDVDAVGVPWYDGYFIG